ncbi:MAG: class I SAM-dependent methyltransferase [Bacteroidetes bacterium]|nr:class I SAM-dependent methyltransferase [Bacteroidota bacterium]
MTPNLILTLKLKEALSDKKFVRVISKDFVTTFERLGFSKMDASILTAKIVVTIMESPSIEEAETIMRDIFTNYSGSNGKNVLEVINDGLQKRFEIIYQQLLYTLPKDGTKTLDYGCGSGTLTQMLHDRGKLDIEGVDVRDFRAEGVSVPILLFDGYHVPVPDKHYECAILTNVIHHDAENERILQELDRIVTKKLIIIETVPEADNEKAAKKDWNRMLLNDTLWNRFFNYADIPVPGTYEIPSNWIKRFRKYGWGCPWSEDLGFDQPTIQDRHHLFVFDRCTGSL